MARKSLFSRCDEAARFLRFAVTGFINTAIDFFVFFVLSSFGVGLILSQAVSYSAGMLSSFLINRSWTFGSERPIFGVELVRFAVTSLGLMALSMVVLKALVMGVGFPRMFGKVLTVGCTLVFGFVINRFWVFRQKKG